MDILSPRTNRVQKLNFNAREVSINAPVSYLQQSAPSLEILSLQQTSKQRMISTNQSTIILFIFNNSAPALRGICLSRVSVPWTIPTYGLTHLELYRQPDSAAPSMEIFLQILSNCLRLEVLILVSSGPPEVSDYPTPSRLVELPYMDWILLSNRDVNIARLLAHLSLPSAPAISLPAN